MEPLIHEIQSLLGIGAEQDAVEPIAGKDLGQISRDGADAHDDDVILHA